MAGSVPPSLDPPWWSHRGIAAAPPAQGPAWTAVRPAGRASAVEIVTSPPAGARTVDDRAVYSTELIVPPIRQSSRSSGISLAGWGPYDPPESAAGAVDVGSVISRMNQSSQSGPSPRSASLRQRLVL